MADPIFIVERRTPRSVYLEAATMVAVKADGKGYSIWLLKRDNPQAGRALEVMNALIRVGKSLPLGRRELAKCHEAGLSHPSTAAILEGTTYVGKQANGRPAMVIVKG